jgi:4-hydroxybenzoate polyprenyltransferase and related prenyltransferases
MSDQPAVESARSESATGSRLDTAIGYVELGRPVNAGLLAMFGVVGAYIAGGATAATGPGMTAGAVTLLAVVGGFAVNDYFDRDIDRVNDPERPIPRGAVAPQNALIIAAVAFGSAGTIAVTALPSPAAGVVLVSIVALVVYTPLIKGRYGLGNLLIAGLVGVAAALGGLVTETPGPAVVMGLLATQMLFGLEVLKDLEDVVGDKQAGLQTLPLVLGQRTAVWIILGVLAATVPLSLVPVVRETFGLAYLLVIGVAHVLTGITMWATVARSPATALSVIKPAMAVCMMAFVAGRMVGV